MVKRIGAVLAAVAMVVVALVVRDGLDGDDAATTPIGSPDAPATASLVCARALADACESDDLGDVIVETAGTTADRVVAATSAGELDGAWLTTSAWADLVLSERARLGRPALFEIVGEPLATSAVAVVVWSDRLEQLVERCGRFDWGCLAATADTPLAGGDRVRAGMPPVHTADGLVVAAHQAASLLGTSDFAANDFDAAFRSAAGALAAGQRVDPLAALRSRGPGEQTAVGVLAASTSQLTSNFGDLRSAAVNPDTTAAVVLVAPTGAGVDESTRRALLAGLEAAGWRPGGAAAELPAGGVLAAIRTLWSESS